MSSGFATVSGTVLAAYMNFGAEASHLITSSVMAAPATLAFSKLIYPETEVSQTTSKAFTLEKPYVFSLLLPPPWLLDYANEFFLFVN